MFACEFSFSEASEISPYSDGTVALTKSLARSVKSPVFPMTNWSQQEEGNDASSIWREFVD